MRETGRIHGWAHSARGDIRVDSISRPVQWDFHDFDLIIGSGRPKYNPDLKTGWLPIGIRR